jgi:hypothetical protein
MREMPKWPGFWRCPDYDKPLNGTPPFQYKCTGKWVSQKAIDGLNTELLRIWIQENKHKN